MMMIDLAALDKVSQLVKKSQELGFQIDELEIESEEEKEE
jgi:hypothetical protein